MNPHDFLRYETACFNSVTPTSKHIIISPKAESKQVTFVYHKWQNGNSDFSLLLRNQFGLRFKPVSKKKKKVLTMASPSHLLPALQYINYSLGQVWNSLWTLRDLMTSWKSKWANITFTKNGHIINSDSFKLRLAKAKERSKPLAQLEIPESQTAKPFVW